MTRFATILCTLATALVCSQVEAAQVKRIGFDLKGDYKIIGNAGGYECAPTLIAPTTGTVGNCGTGNLADDSPDIFWQAGDTTAVANKDVTPAQARTTAMLSLPANAQVVYARLYWGAQISVDNTGGADTQVTIERPNGASTTVTAQSGESWTSDSGTARYYQATADISNFVAQNGNGAYRVSGIGSYDFRNVTTDLDVTIGWGLVVVYELSTEPLRNIVLFDGFDPVTGGGTADVTLDGFLVPSSGGISAKLGVLAYEGDNGLTGDQLLFDRVPITAMSTALSDALNPVDDFFNGTHSFLGASATAAGDLPRLLGTAGSMSNFDLDVVDVTGKLQANDETAYLRATSTGDLFFLGGFFTSVSSISPGFTDTSLTFVDLNPHANGAVLPGDTLEFTLTVVNNGNDTAVNVGATTVLPAGLDYVAGSLAVTSGANTGALTDASGDDTGEYTSGTRTVSLRVGTDASASAGGQVAAGETVVITYHVTVAAATDDQIIYSQATISAQGMSDPPPKVTKLTLSGFNHVAAQKTPVFVCNATTGTCGVCTQSSQCPDGAPVCNTSTMRCVRCLLNGDCPVGALCTAAQCVVAVPTVGSPTSGSVTNSTMPTFSGTAVAGSIVTVYLDGTIIGTTTANSGGNWTFSPMMSIAPGMHTVSVTATVGAGVTSATSTASATSTFTIITGCLQNSECGATTPICDTTNNTCVRCQADTDCVAQSTCVNDACVLVPPSVATPASNATVDSTRPAFTGTAEPGSTVVVSVDGTVIGTVTADNNGQWVYIPTSDIAPGAHVVTATSSVGAGPIAVTSQSTTPSKFTVPSNASSGVGTIENSLAGGGFACDYGGTRGERTGAAIFALAAVFIALLRRRSQAQ